MPEKRLEKTREAYKDAPVLPWRPPHVNAADQLQRKADAHLGAVREAE